jgi:hypothetical protein
MILTPFFAATTSRKNRLTGLFMLALALGVGGCEIPGVLYHLDRVNVLHVNPTATRRMIRVDAVWEFDGKPATFAVYQEKDPRTGTVMIGTDQVMTLNFSMGAPFLGWKQMTTLTFSLTCSDPTAPGQPLKTYDNLAPLDTVLVAETTPDAVYEKERTIRLSDPTGTSVVEISYHLERFGGKPPKTQNAKK